MLFVGLEPLELDIEIGTMLVDIISIMASKRIILWKEYMSRDKPHSWLPRNIH
jgi:hypothetical protein